MASKRKYNDDFRASAVLLLEAQGYPGTKGALTAVAKRLGVPQRTLSRWFNKEQNPPPPELVKEKRAALTDRLDHIIDLLIDEMETAVKDAPLNHLATTFGIAVDKKQKLEQAALADPTGDERPFTLPADVLAPSFVGAYRDIRDHRHTEYLFYGGRGSTKSSFVSLVIVYLLINNPTMHALAARHVGNTLRDSVFSQLSWAIDELGLSEQFKRTTNPLEITYRPTGQRIYFRGADDPLKIKSIKPPFGYIGILWLEELDQFRGPEAVRSIEQSAIRGGDVAYIFKSFNPPKTASAWANKYVQIPKASQLRHHSTYLDAPAEWLGQTFLDEAEHLREVNPTAYQHEYLGEATGTGGLVFDNLDLRRIEDAEIAQFDRVLHGLDFGWFPDPAAYNRCHYDAARLTLYIYDEWRANKVSNRGIYDALAAKGIDGALLIADSAEPKSIADIRSYGANIRPAEKGPESVNYSMKWLQSLKAIVIDPVRCPATAQEFQDYELEQDKDGEFISAYPDRDNHHIDAVRYATNLIWRKRGQ